MYIQDHSSSSYKCTDLEILMHDQHRHRLILPDRRPPIPIPDILYIYNFGIMALNLNCQ